MPLTLNQRNADFRNLISLWRSRIGSIVITSVQQPIGKTAWSAKIAQRLGLPGWDECLHARR